MSDATPVRSVSVGRKVAFWVCTVLISLAMGAGGIADILRIDDVVKGMKALGYPEYVCVIIGVWKVLGTIVILAPRIPLLKEWAYAGIVFDLTGASASHFAVGDETSHVIVPLVLTVVTLISWRTRYGSRQLPKLNTTTAA